MDLSTNIKLITRSGTIMDQLQTISVRINLPFSRLRSLCYCILIKFIILLTLERLLYTSCCQTSSEVPTRSWFLFHSQHIIFCVIYLLLKTTSCSPLILQTAYLLFLIAECRCTTLLTHFCTDALAFLKSFSYPTVLPFFIPHFIIFFPH
jgi:hypothetical protein